MSLTPNDTRLHGLDALRGGALLLGVALHGAMAWLPGSEHFWITSDADSTPVLAVFFHWVHSFRMTLFFLLAGFFGGWLLQRRGVAGFLRDRARRIAMPLAALWFPLLMAVVAVLTWAAWLKNGGTLPPQDPPPPLSVDNFPLMHLWFLYLLLPFYAGLVALRGLARLDRGGRVDAALTWAAGRVSPVLAVLLALPAAAMLGALPAWWGWFGVPTPDQSLLPNAAAVVAYGVAFAAGAWLQHRRTLLAAVARQWRVNLALAVVATATCLAIAGPVSPATPMVHAHGYAVAYALTGWAWTLALTGMALRFLATANATRRYLADASYWVYLMHLPVVMALQVAAGTVDAPWWIEFPACVGIAMALLLGSWHLVRGTWLGRWLGPGRGVATEARLPAALPAAG